jgi:hypothetical protein
MTWKDIISKTPKHTAGRSNPDDFREYGTVTPMGHPKGHKPKKKIAKPLSDEEKLRRRKRNIATRKRNKEKRALEAKRKTERRLPSKDIDTIIAEEDEKERQRLKDGPKDIFPKGD